MIQTEGSSTFADCDYLRDTRVISLEEELSVEDLLAARRRDVLDLKCLMTDSETPCSSS